LNGPLNTALKNLFSIIEVKIYHDEEVEDNEFFGIQLANPSGRNVGLGQNKLVTKK
jgi:hypothetical protein